MVNNNNNNNNIVTIFSVSEGDLVELLRLEQKKVNHCIYFLNNSIIRPLA